MIAHKGHVGADGHAGQTVAVNEGIFVDIGDGVGNVDLGQVIGFVEGTVSDGGSAVRDGIGAASSAGEGDECLLVLAVKHTVNGSKQGIAFFHIEVLQTIAPGKIGLSHLGKPNYFLICKKEKLIR